MGFTDDQRIKFALIVCDGDLEKAINFISDENNNNLLEDKK